MRKVKKINGYLVVRFNERELREWAGHGLGNYGVIDAELYTGNLDIDRDAMEYDDAETLELALEQARSLESELDIEDPAVAYTVIKDTEDGIIETEVDPQQLFNYEKMNLSNQVHRPSSNFAPFAAEQVLRGYRAALADLELIGSDDCVIIGNEFSPGSHDTLRTAIAAIAKCENLAIGYLEGGPYCDDKPGADLANAIIKTVRKFCEDDNSSEDFGIKRHRFGNLPEYLARWEDKICRIGEALETRCPENDCRIFLNQYRQCLEIATQTYRLTGFPRELLERELRKLLNELAAMYVNNYAIRVYRQSHESKESVLKMMDTDMHGLTISIDSNEPYHGGLHKAPSEECP